MSATEVAHRLREKVHQCVERRHWKNGIKTDSVPAEAGFAMCRQLFPGLSEGVSLGLFQATSHDLRRHPILGREFDLTEEIDWHLDPVSRYRWPETFYGDLQLYRLENGADIKYPWELSRHQFFLSTLVATANDASAHEEAWSCIKRHWLDWIDHNPLYQGVNWTSGLEAAMRSISWILTIATIEGDESKRLPEQQCRRIMRSLVDHATYLEHHFSYYTSPYNHLVGEATALFLLSLVLAQHPSAGRWHKQARETLLTFGPKQFYSDGFCVEQAVSYHFYTIGFLLLSIVAAQATGVPFKELELSVHRALTAGRAFRRPDGRWPAVGDLDSARALPLPVDDFWNFAGLCDCGASLFDDPELVTSAGKPGSEVAALLGSEAVEKWHLLSQQADTPPTYRVVLPESGYVLASSESDWLLFDAGPICDGLFRDSTPSTGHGHADTLQVLYFARGMPVLDDGGIPFYNGSEDWIRHYRSPAAHNTVSIEGCELVHPEGRLAWSREVTPPTLTTDLTADRWMCSGTIRWPGVTFERHVLCIPQTGLWIADLIETDRPRWIKWNWQIPCSSTAISASQNGACWADMSLQLESEDGDNTVTLTQSSEGKPEAWRCHGYQQQSPGTVLTHDSFVREKRLLLTSVGDVSRPPVKVSLAGSSAGSGQRVRLGAWPAEHQGCRWLVEQQAKSTRPEVAGAD